MKPTQQPEQKRWLNISWKVIAAYGIMLIFFAILVPFQSYFTLPNQPMFIFGSSDEKFTGLSWDKIMSFNSELGTWIVLTMVSMCAMMMSVGVLTFMIARHAYRAGEYWAWKALVVANALTISYYTFFIGGIQATMGLPFWTLTPGSSGIGADFFTVIAIVWLFFGFWLPRKELKHQGEKMKNN